MAQKNAGQTTEMVALGLLFQGPLHGYQIKQRFRDRGLASFTRLSFGSLYHALRKLEDRGLIQKEKAERVGRRPERLVFGITTAGKERLRALVDESLRTVERQYYAIDPALAFSAGMGRSALVPALRERRDEQADIVAHIEQEVTVVEENVRKGLNGKVAQKERVFTLAISMIQHALAHERAELEWLEALVSELESQQ